MLAHVLPVPMPAHSCQITILYQELGASPQGSILLDQSRSWPLHFSCPITGLGMGLPSNSAIEILGQVGLGAELGRLEHLFLNNTGKITLYSFLFCRYFASIYAWISGSHFATMRRTSLRDGKVLDGTDSEN